MIRKFKTTTILKQLLVTLLPIVLTIILVLSYTQYRNTLFDIKEREKQKHENIKNGVQLFVDNYDLSLSLIELKLNNRITYLSDQILRNHKENLFIQDLDALKTRLKMDKDHEDLYVINLKGVIINATKKHDIGINLTSFGTSYQKLLDRVHKQKKLIIERIATESKTKTPKKFGYVAISNNYILEIGVVDTNTKSLITNFSSKLKDLENQYTTVESVDLFAATEYLPAKNKDGKIAQNHKQIAISCYTQKKDTILELADDKKISFSYLPMRKTSIYKGYVLQIITNNTAVNTLVYATKKNFFFTLLTTLLLLSFVIYFLSKKITKPIYKLTTQIKENNNSQKLDYITVNGNYEINYLAQEFNKHIKNTKEQHLKLEEQIAARTQLLNLKNTELEKIANERALLLEEIHHRVKNNLQLVSSLLNLQIKETTNLEAINALENSKNRIKTISLIHDKLCQNANFINTYASEYLQDLALIIQQNAPKDIKITIQPSAVIFNNDQATAVGLIVHEFIMNSIKHAFESIEKPEINISIETLKNNIIIKLFNNGKLLDTAFDLNKTPSLGNKIIQGFVQILKGSFVFENDKNKEGVVMIITFPKAI